MLSIVLAGVVNMKELLHWTREHAGKPAGSGRRFGRETLGTVADELDRLDDLARVMTDASICGLGQTASSAIQSAIRLQLRGAPA